MINCARASSPSATLPFASARPSSSSARARVWSISALVDSIDSTVFACWFAIDSATLSACSLSANSASVNDTTLSAAVCVPLYMMFSPSVNDAMPESAQFITVRIPFTPCRTISSTLMSGPPSRLIRSPPMSITVCIVWLAMLKVPCSVSPNRRTASPTCLPKRLSASAAVSSIAVLMISGINSRSASISAVPQSKAALVICFAFLRIPDANDEIKFAAVLTILGA